MLDISTAPLKGTGASMLAEIHENYHIQKKLAARGHYVYDFALPLLLLHGLMFGRTDRLIHWLQICPHNQFTTLDTHDGIGVVDAAELLTMDEMQAVAQVVSGRLADGWAKLPEEVLQRNAMWNSMIRRSDGKVKLYQLGGTFFSAMGEDEDGYLLARIIQFFTPGIPQVYYVGMLAGLNDFEAVCNGAGPREINRHNFTVEEIEERIQMPMLQKMYEIMRFRNTCPAFDGEFFVNDQLENGLLEMRWSAPGSEAVLNADLRTKTWEIRWTDESGAVHTITRD